MDSAHTSQSPSHYGGKRVSSDFNTTWVPPQNPFGYSFQDVPAPPPPIPAPGEALLNDSETNKFHDFFNQMEVGHFDDDTFMFGDLGQSAKHDPSWMLSDDPSGLYSGATNSLTPSGVHSALPTNGSLDELFHNPFDSRQNHTLPNPSTTSPTILAAASTLMRNGHFAPKNGHQNNLSKMSFDGLGTNGLRKTPNRRETIAYENPSYASHSREMFGIASQGPYGQGVPANIRHKSTTAGRAVFPDGVVAAPSDPYIPLWSGSKFPTLESGPRLQWGSDNNFAQNHFVPPEGLETVAQVTDGLLERVQTFQHQSSAATTQPSSPVMPKKKRKAEPHLGETAVPDSLDDGEGADDTAVTESHRTAKRRKARQEVKAEQPTEEDGRDDESEPKARRGKRPKRASEKPGRQSRPGSNADKGSASARKNGRMNLTEEQRSSNHIKSEQKRRDIIKKGFQDVMAIVPDCRDSGISRSVVLMATCDWLDYLIPGNARLKEQLASLEEGQGAGV